MLVRRLILAACFTQLFLLDQSTAEQPSVSYIYPAGGQRGETVSFHVGGHYLHGRAGFEILGPGVDATKSINEVETLWFEGPVIPMPASQQAENYPRDHAGEVIIAADANLGVRHWQVWTSQGATSRKKFIVGNLPELVEKGIDGSPIPVEVSLPITINGRIFPREDVDLWTFSVNEGELVTCEVNAERLGSPLEARLVILDPSGKLVTESLKGIGKDPRLRFRADQSGIYTVRIHDVRFGGLQDYVYRLTITNEPYIDRVFPLGGRRGTTLKLSLSGQRLPQSPIEVQLPSIGQVSRHSLSIGGHYTNEFRLQLDDLPEYVESKKQLLSPIAVPAIFNGRIDTPGNVDQWKIQAKKGDRLELDLQADRLGSPIDSVLLVLDSRRKELARNDDISGSLSDSKINFQVPADGTYLIQVSDRFSSRGGEEFAYRLKVAKKKVAEDFSLMLGSDVVTVFRHPKTDPIDEQDKRIRNDQIKQAVLKIDARRQGGFNDEIVLQISGLPEGVTVTGEKIAAGKNSTQLQFKAAPSTKIDVTRISISAAGKIQGHPVSRIAVIPTQDDSPELETVLLAVALPTPFRFYSDYKISYAARGSVYSRNFKLHRGGFEGPISVRLADRQIRHLQGVHGPLLTIPTDATEFEYPIHLPPWMQMGRTSRSVIMLSSEIVDHDGTKYMVSYSSGEQYNQLIVLVSPGELSVKCETHSVLAIPHRSVKLVVRVDRAPSLGEIASRVELIIPRHILGISAEPVILPPEKREATLVMEFSDSISAINMPLTIRVTTLDQHTPVVAETSLELAVATAAE